MSIQGKQTEFGLYEFEYMRKVDTSTNWEKFQRTIWNSSTNEFLGRTAKSWAQIISFYMIFYAVLAALFAICMYGLLWTIDQNEPKWKLSDSLIGTNPGMGFRPISDSTEEGSLIWYDSKNTTSVEKWTSLLDNFLDTYLHSAKLPGGGKNQKICEFGEKREAGKVCAVDVADWGLCSSQAGYGYNRSSPCIFLKLNKIYAWEPDFYNGSTPFPEDMPMDLQQHIVGLPVEERNQIWISCSGENPADNEVIGDIEYIPTRGLPNYYYPYSNTPGYLNPVLAIRLVRPKLHVLINIECRAWAKNIIYRGGNQYREGSVHIELMID